jgi:hypothetical protein
MRRALLAVALLAAVAIVAPAAATQRAGGFPKLTIPLPGLSADAIKTVTLKGKATGKISVATLNNAKLGNESIVYVAKSPKGGKGTFKIYALIKRFANDRSTASASASGDDLELEVKDFNWGGTDHSYRVKDESGNCEALAELGSTFEHSTRVTKGSLEWVLAPGRPSNVQGSQPEEVLDQVVLDVWGSCPGNAEPWDSGPG